MSHAIPVYASSGERLTGRLNPRFDDGGRTRSPQRPVAPGALRTVLRDVGPLPGRRCIETRQFVDIDAKCRKGLIDVVGRVGHGVSPVVPVVVAGRIRLDRGSYVDVRCVQQKHSDQCDDQDRQGNRPDEAHEPSCTCSTSTNSSVDASTLEVPVPPPAHAGSLSSRA